MARVVTNLIVKVELDRSGVLTDISNRVSLVKGSYGRRAESSQFSTGRVRVVADSADNFITPGAFASRDASRVQGGRVIIQTETGGVVTSQFHGQVDQITHRGDEYDAGFDLVCTDGFATLAQASVAADLPRELTGQRISRVLDLVGYPSDGSARDVDDGTVVCLEQFVEGDVLSVLRTCALTEGGALFVSHSGTEGGVLTFRQRRVLPPVSVTVSDTPDSDVGSLQADGAPQTQQDQSQLANIVVFNTPDGERAFAESLESQETYLAHTFERDVYCALFDAQSLAEWWVDLNSLPQFRITRVDVAPAFESSAAAVSALGASIGDAVNVKYTPRGATRQIEAVSTIESVFFEFRPFSGGVENSGVNALIGWSLLPAIHSGYWLLADSESGVLGSTTRLGPPDNSTDALLGTNRPVGRERWVDGDLVTAQAFSGGVSSQVPSLYGSTRDLHLGDHSPSVGQSARITGTSRLDLSVYTGSRFTTQLALSGEIVIPPIAATISNRFDTDTWRVVFSEPVVEADAIDRMNYTLDRGDGNGAQPLPASASFSLNGNLLLITNVGAVTNGGETFRILPRTIRDASDDERFVAATSFEVPEPTTPITTTITSFAVRDIGISVFFSGRVDADDAVNRNFYSLTTGTGIVPLPASAVLTFHSPDIVVITLPDFIRYGQTFRVLGDSIAADDSSGRFAEAATASLPAQPIYQLTASGVLGESRFTVSTPVPLVASTVANLAAYISQNLLGSISSATYSGNTITLNLTEPLDGGEVFGIFPYEIETTDGNFLQQASWTVGEPTNPITATISATIGSPVVLIDFSEGVVGSDTEAATAFRLNDALFPFGTTYEYNSGLNRTTITSARALTFGDEIRVLGGLINAADSSGRRVSGATHTLAAQEPVAATISAERGSRVITIVYEHPVENAAASSVSSFGLTGFQTGTTFSVSYDSSSQTTTISASVELDGGEVIAIGDDVIRALGGAFVVATSFTVPEPTAEITATISGVEVGSTEIVVTFSEPVVGANQPSGYSLSGSGASIPAASGISYSDTTATITLASILNYGQTFSVVGRMITADDSSGRTVTDVSASVGEQPAHNIVFQAVRGNTGFAVIASDVILDRASATNFANYNLANFGGTLTSINYSIIGGGASTFLQFLTTAELDGGEQFGWDDHTIATTDGHFLDARSFTVAEPTDDITATILATVGSRTVLVSFSEDVVAADAVLVSSYRLNSALFIGATITYDEAARRATIAAVSDITYEDTIAVVGGVINADDSSGRQVVASSLTLPAQPPVGVTISASIGSGVITIVYDAPVENAAASDINSFAFASLDHRTTLTISYNSATRTTTITASIPFDGGENVAVLGDTIRALGGAYVEETEFNVPEPTAAITSNIDDPVQGDESFTVTFSEDVFGATESSAYQINGAALPSTSITYTNRVATITLSRPLAGNDVITVLGDAILSDDSSGRFVVGDTFTVERVALPELPIDLTRAQVGQFCFAPRTSSSDNVNEAEALTEGNWLINGAATAVEVIKHPSTDRFIVFIPTALAAGDVLSVTADNIFNDDGSATFVGSHTVGAADTIAYSYTIEAEPDTNTITLVFNNGIQDRAAVVSATADRITVDGERAIRSAIPDGLLTITGTTGTPAGTSTYFSDSNTLVIDLDDALEGGDVITFNQYAFYSFGFGICVPQVIHTVPEPETPGPPIRITSVTHNRTAVPLVVNIEHDDSHTALQLRRKTYRTEGRAPNNGLTLEREDWPIRHRYRINSNTRWHHFANTANGAGDIVTTGNTITVNSSNWAGGSTPINLAVRAKLADGTYTEWSDDFTVDIQQPIAHSPVAHFTGYSIAANGELTLSWDYSDADGSPQATYYLWTVPTENATRSTTWNYIPPSREGAAGELAFQAVQPNSSTSARSALIHADWQSDSISAEDDVVFHLEVIDGNGHRSYMQAIRVPKP